MGSTVFRMLQTVKKALRLHLWDTVFSILNPIDPLVSVSNLYLYVQLVASLHVRTNSVRSEELGAVLSFSIIVP